MTPKEKATELICKMWGSDNPEEYKYILKFANQDSLEDAIKCALIHTEELIKHLKAYSAGDLVIFYREVDKEINNLKQ